MSSFLLIVSWDQCPCEFFVKTTSLLRLKQESPPAWTQEAYRPRRIKYYRGGVLPPPSRGTPGQVWWGVTRGGVSPHQDTPQSGLTGGTRGGVPPIRVPSLSGYSPARSDGGLPEVGYPPSGTPLARSDGGGTWGGVPPHRDTPLVRVAPPSGYPPPARSDGGYLRWTWPHWTWPG